MFLSCSEQKLLEASNDLDDDDGDEEDEEMSLGKVEAAGRRAGGPTSKPFATTSAAATAATARAAAAAAAAQQVFPLFPYAEPKRSFDVWGETLTDEERRIISGLPATTAPLLSGPSFHLLHGGGGAGKADAMMSDAPSSLLAMGGGADDANGAGAGELDTPQKSVLTTLHLPLQCAVQYLDFEGRSDGRSIKTVIKDVQPRKLVSRRPTLKEQSKAEQSSSDAMDALELCDSKFFVAAAAFSVVVVFRFF